MNKLIVNKVSKRYKKTILYNFSYEFNQGKIIGIVGPSGSGKSTLLSMIANDIKKYKGIITYNDFDIKSLKNYTFLNVGYVYQNHQLLEELTALENVSLYFDLIKEKKEKYYYTIKNLFKEFKVLHTLNIKVKHLSLGEKQRIALIRAFIKNPDILLLDEPTSSLDSNSRDLLFDHLNKIKKDKIIIIVSHDLNVIERFDEVIDLKDYKNNKPVILNKVKKTKEKKLRFYKLSKLYKKVFKSKQILNYISCGILSFGLVSISLSFVIKDFINDVISASFKDFDTSNYVSVRSNQINSIVDFKEEFKDAIYYQGLESSFKNKIKSNSLIKYADFNYYDIANIDFIFDNYLSTYDKNIVLEIPISAKEYIKNKNYINVYFNQTSFSILVYEIIYSEEDNFYLYCNNVNYLLSYFLSLNITPNYSYFLYTNDIENDYNKLINSPKYHSYYFEKYSENIISIYKSEMSRISLDTCSEFLSSNNIGKYLISDYTHTYIDYDTGLIYLLEKDNKMAQIVIDDSIKDDCVAVSNKYIKDKENKSSIKIFKKRYQVVDIKNNIDASVIYMNINTFNNINNKNQIYCMLIINDNSNELKASDGVMINTKLFDFSSIKAFSYIISFIMFFAILLIVLAYIATLITFSFNLFQKKKDILILKRFGVYKHKIFTLFLYEPITNILTSILSCTLSIFISKIMISILYYNMTFQTLDIKISISFLISLIFIPFLVIIPLIIFKIMRFINKNI